MSIVTEKATVLEYSIFVQHFGAILAEHNKHIISSAALYSPHFYELMRTAGEALQYSPHKRPYFAYLGYKGAGGIDDRIFNELGIGLELYDAALLLHDDIIDDDNMRNGRPNVYGAYIDKIKGTNPKKSAASLGVIAGDALYGLAFEKLLHLPIDALKQEGIARALFRAHFVLHAGQCTDITTETQDLSELTEGQIIAGYKLKNQFNLEMPMQMGALAGGASQRSAAMISSFAYPLGAAIQIANDVDVLFSERFDSKTTADLRGNKKTLIIWYAWQRSDAKERAFILSCMGNENITSEEVMDLKKLLEKTEARQRAYDKGKDYVCEAVRSLDTLDWITHDVKQNLHDFIQSIDNRLR